MKHMEQLSNMVVQSTLNLQQFLMLDKIMPRGILHWITSSEFVELKTNLQIQLVNSISSSGNNQYWVRNCPNSRDL